MAEQPQKVIVVGVDDSQQSVYALQWILDNLLSFLPLEEENRPFTIVLVHARPTAASVPQGHIAAPDPRAIGARVIARARAICLQHNFQHVHSEEVEGDARNVLCEAVERYHATILVVGSAMDRAVLGSVSDYCADHARCSVIVVKRPNI